MAHAVGYRETTVAAIVRLFQYFNFNSDISTVRAFFPVDVTRAKRYDLDR